MKTVTHVRFSPPARESLETRFYRVIRITCWPYTGHFGTAIFKWALCRELLSREADRLRLVSR